MKDPVPQLLPDRLNASDTLATFEATEAAKAWIEEQLSALHIYKDDLHVQLLESIDQITDWHRREYSGGKAMNFAIIPNADGSASVIVRDDSFEGIIILEQYSAELIELLRQQAGGDAALDTFIPDSGRDHSKEEEYQRIYNEGFQYHTLSAQEQAQEAESTVDGLLFRAKTIAATRQAEEQWHWLEWKMLYDKLNHLQYEERPLTEEEKQMFSRQEEILGDLDRDEVYVAFESSLDDYMKGDLVWDARGIEALKTAMGLNGQYGELLSNSQTYLDFSCLPDPTFTLFVDKCAKLGKAIEGVKQLGSAPDRSQIS